MPDFSSLLGALPIGLLFMLGTFLAMRRRKVGWRQASEDFPKVAQRLGLEFKASPHERAIGTIRGRFEGYDVFVEPDEQAKIVVRFASERPVLFRTYEQTKHIPSGLTRFDSGIKRFDELFRDRYASEAMADELSDRKEDLARAVEPFRRTRPLKDLVVGPDYVALRFEFGRPSHIPGQVVEEALPALVALARVVDVAHGAAGSEARADEPESLADIVG